MTDRINLALIVLLVASLVNVAVGVATDQGVFALVSAGLAAAAVGVLVARR